MIRVTTQAELDAALKTNPGAFEVEIRGGGDFLICGSAQVRAHGSAQVTAYGSAQVRAHDSAQVRAYGSAQVTACDSAQVTASRYVAVTYSLGVRVRGGVKIKLQKIRTFRQWCDFYGVAIVKGIATLFKSVREDFTNGKDGKFSYAPGSTPSAPDWDPEPECGGGLHMSPTPFHALKFHDETGRKFVACPVRASVVVVHEDATYPDKVKAPRCCAPVWECDIDGNPVKK